MRITYKGDYSLKAILFLTLNAGRLMTITELAKAADIPVKFLEQVLLDLKRGGFVESKRGKGGGYLLARHAAKITVGDVVRFVDGPLEPIACVDRAYDNCRDMDRCLFRPLWKRVADETSRILDDINFEQLANKIKAGQQRPSYNI